jgi:hypothetical protein
MKEDTDQIEMCEGCGGHAPTGHLQGWDLCDACQRDALA